MTESQYYYNKYKSLGVCTKCRKNQAVHGKSMCESCLEKHRLRAKEYRQSKDDYKDRVKAYRQKRREEAKKTGMCMTCFKETADKGFTTCWRCRANSKRTTSYIMSEEQKQQSRERENTRRQRLITEHICVCCGKRPAMNGKQKCKLCSAKHNRNRRLKKQALGLCISSDMRGDGVYCQRCCKPNCHGEKVCPECKEKLQELAERLNEVNRENGYCNSREFRRKVKTFYGGTPYEVRKAESDFIAVRFNDKKKVR